MKNLVLAFVTVMFTVFTVSANNTDPKLNKKDDNKPSKMIITSGKTYYWQVETNSGVARGITRNEAYAKKNDCVSKHRRNPKI